MTGKICKKCETEMTIMDGYWVCLNGHKHKVSKEEKEIPAWAQED